MKDRIDYGREPGMIPAPMTTRIYHDLQSIEKTITIETGDWKALYRLSHFNMVMNGGAGSEVDLIASYYLDDVTVFDTGGQP